MKESPIEIIMILTNVLNLPPSRSHQQDVVTNITVAQTVNSIVLISSNTETQRKWYI